MPNNASAVDFLIILWLTRNTYPVEGFFGSLCWKVNLRSVVSSPLFSMIQGTKTYSNKSEKYDYLGEWMDYQLLDQNFWTAVVIIDFMS